MGVRARPLRNSYIQETRERQNQLTSQTHTHKILNKTTMATTQKIISRSMSILRNSGFGRGLLNTAKINQKYEETIQKTAESFVSVRFTPEQLAKSKPVHDAVKSRPLTPAPAIRMREVKFDHSDPIDNAMLMEKTNYFSYFEK